MGGPEGADLSIDEIKDASVAMGGAQPGHPDGMAALAAAVGMLLGLYARDRGHGGQVTLTSMLSTMGHALSDVLTDYDGCPEAPVTDGDAYGFSALYRTYRAVDALDRALCAPDQRSWERLAGAAPEAGLGDDPRFADDAGQRDHDGELASALTAAFASVTAADWERRLSAAGVGCAEIVAYRGGLGVGLFEERGVGDQLGLLTLVVHPLFDEHVRSTELVRLSRAVPTLVAGCTVGQHTDEVLGGLLGYDPARLAGLRAPGFIGG